MKKEHSKEPVKEPLTMQQQVDAQWALQKEPSALTRPPNAKSGELSGTALTPEQRLAIQEKHLREAQARMKVENEAAEKAAQKAYEMHRRLESGPSKPKS